MEKEGWTVSVVILDIIVILLFPSSTYLKRIGLPPLSQKQYLDVVQDFLIYGIEAKTIRLRLARVIQKNTDSPALKFGRYK